MTRSIVLMAVLMVGCAGWRDRPAGGEARSYYYADNSGVSVKSLAATLEQPIASHLDLSFRGMTEQITLERKPLDVADPGAMQSTGHPPHEPDAVTSASSTAGGGAVKEEWRFEGIASATLAREVAGAPGKWQGLVKASTEPDYRALYGSVGGTIELAERNTTLSGFVGYGQDRVEPVEAPAGQSDDWPAEHTRLNGALTLSQLLTPEMTLSAGLGGTRQAGQLASPYRRALVRSTLFPEVVPDTRLRGTAFVALSRYLGRDTAIHLRQGVYADSWEVLALIPELSVAPDFGDDWMLSARYRFYKQWSAYFYEGRYRDLEPLLTGDPRLGRIAEHTLGAQARWSIRDIALLLSYDVSILDYEDYATAEIIGHVMSFGVTASY